jgi:S-adenosylmethionine synthetase
MKLYTAETVAAGHPDKVADEISDAILDATIAQDPQARVAVETLVTKNLVVLAGEIRGPKVDYERIVREVILDLGYVDPLSDFSYDGVEVVTRLQEQSPGIAKVADQEAAGDQGTVYGYATNETPTLMPAPLYHARAIRDALYDIRRDGGFGPDGKVQVAVSYDHNGPKVESIFVGQNVGRYINHQYAQRRVEERVRQLYGSLPRLRVDTFTFGGPGADTGLTGRKIIVDTYGGACPHGGGAFSGKDATKMDRAGAYAARQVAKAIVADGYALRCLVSVSYEFGLAEPVAVDIDTFGTGIMLDEELKRVYIRDLHQMLTPKSIRTRLGLEAPIYRQTTRKGHFGNDVFPWEKKP